MQNIILLIGAGRSSTYLVKYLLEHANKNNFKLWVADYHISEYLSSLKDDKNLILYNLSDFKQNKLDILIKKSNIVISLLPANLHYQIALKCLDYSKNFVTASYTSTRMKELDLKVKEKNLIFLNEVGLDPGIDHMSTMNLLEQHIPEQAIIYSYKSHCGGILNSTKKNNLWDYKFTWNPTNVILAGQGEPACYLDNGQIKYQPYNNLFKNAYTLDNIHGSFEVYPNRDSLKYQEVYGLTHVKTLQRTTIRRPGFCKAWSILIDLGLTDNSYMISNLSNTSFATFFKRYIKQTKSCSLKQQVEKTIGYNIDQITWDRIQELELWTNEQIIYLEQGSPAQVLEALLLKKWKLMPQDKDMVIMHHQIIYQFQGHHYMIQATMKAIGKDKTLTAMAKTVGLPVGIATLKILNGSISDKGVCLPTTRTIYKPILKELESYEIKFEITTKPI
ncbi:saccharopine dehydrogenase C-terminal domain-containing protein [Myroides sp. LJL119]